MIHRKLCRDVCSKEKNNKFLILIPEGSPSLLEAPEKRLQRTEKVKKDHKTRGKHDTAAE